MTIQTEQKFAVGDLVRYRYGLDDVIARIVEDRGRLGINRGRIYRIHPLEREEDDGTFEVPEEELRTFDRDAPLSEREIVDFLNGGGLIAILKRSQTGSTKPIWLRRDSLGMTTFTFVQELGLAGGLRPPFSVLADGRRIFTPKREEVRAYLQAAFELSDDAAESVLRSVGTAV